jgi:hypothetical protein
VKYRACGTSGPPVLRAAVEGASATSPGRSYEAAWYWKVLSGTSTSECRRDQDPALIKEALPAVDLAWPRSLTKRMPSAASRSREGVGAPPHDATAVRGDIAPFDIVVMMTTMFGFLSWDAAVVMERARTSAATPAANPLRCRLCSSRVFLLSAAKSTLPRAWPARGERCARRPRQRQVFAEIQPPRAVGAVPGRAGECSPRGPSSAISRATRNGTAESRSPSTRQPAETPSMRANSGGQSARLGHRVPGTPEQPMPQRLCDARKTPRGPGISVDVP